MAVFTVSSHERAAGRYDDAQRDVSEAHALAERFGYASLATFSQLQLGILAVVRGRLDEAWALLDEGLAVLGVRFAHVRERRSRYVMIAGRGSRAEPPD